MNLCFVEADVKAILSLWLKEKHGVIIAPDKFKFKDGGVQEPDGFRYQYECHVPKRFEAMVDKFAII